MILTLSFVDSDDDRLDNGNLVYDGELIPLADIGDLVSFNGEPKMYKVKRKEYFYLGNSIEVKFVCVENMDE